MWQKWQKKMAMTALLPNSSLQGTLPSSLRLGMPPSFSPSLSPSLLCWTLPLCVNEPALCLASSTNVWGRTIRPWPLLLLLLLLKTSTALLPLPSARTAASTAAISLSLGERPTGSAAPTPSSSCAWGGRSEGEGGRTERKARALRGKASKRTRGRMVSLEGKSAFRHCFQSNVVWQLQVIRETRLHEMKSGAVLCGATTWQV